MNSSVRFERNLGFISDVEQETIEQSTVAIAGAGGDGGLLAVELARMGVGSFRLADPDPFEEENTNRQAVCSTDTIGVNKAEAVGKYIKGINPDADVKIYNEGITYENTADFVESADLVIDETEFTLHALGVMLARESRKRDIPVMTALNVGFGALVTTFRPEGRTLESVIGFQDDESIESIEKKEVPLSLWLPYLPEYGDLKTLEKIASGEKSAPSVAPGVAIAAGMGTTQAFLSLVGPENNRPKPIYAPKAYVFDAMSMDAKTVKFGKMSHTKHLTKVVLRNMFKLNPQASY